MSGRKTEEMEEKENRRGRNHQNDDDGVRRERERERERESFLCKSGKHFFSTGPKKKYNPVLCNSIFEKLSSFNSFTCLF